MLDDHNQLIAILESAGHISLAQSVRSTFARVFLLAAASLYEHRITEALLKYCDSKTAGDTCLRALLLNRAVKRQYHTFFEWDNRKAGPFFSLMGDAHGKTLRNEFTAEPKKVSLDAFLEVGFLRNCLVHQNFSTYSLEKNVHEVAGLCEAAEAFLIRIEEILTI
jgi:hypothetical protein